jgi:hypothetical protein
MYVFNFETVSQFSKLPQRGGILEYHSDKNKSNMDVDKEVHQEEDINGGTFKTEVSIPTSIKRIEPLGDLYEDVRLPSSINSIALRESFLSEAPFVTTSNRTFWRNMIDQQSFRNILAAAYYILADCVSDAGVVNVDKLSNFRESPYSRQMSVNLADMYFSPKLIPYQHFFLRIPEILAFMLVCSLRTSIPKHHRLCQAGKFREILLDWCCEVVGGIRFTNSKTNREWFFTDVLESQILTTSAMNVGPNTSKVLSNTTHGSVKTKYQICLSPLIEMYIGHSSHANAALSVNLNMSHPPNRALCPLSASAELKSGRARLKHIDYTTISDVLQQSNTYRKKISAERMTLEKDASTDLRKMNKQFKTSLRELNVTAAKGVLPNAANTTNVA